MDHLSTFAECLACHAFEMGARDPDARSRLPCAPGRPAGKGKLAPYQAFFNELVAQDPDITLFELRDALAAAAGVSVYSFLDCRAAVPPRVHVQKKSLVAAERRRARVSQARHDWHVRRVPAMRRRPERLVFIDETSVKTNLTRLRGRAPRGERLEMDAPFDNWGTQNFIAGLTAEGLIGLLARAAARSI